MKHTKGKFIRWTCKDDAGNFSHVGQVVSHANGLVTFVTQSDGVMSIPEDDGKFSKVRKPRSWSVDVATVKSKSLKRKKKQTKGGVSKLDLVVELLRADPPVNRKDAISKIVDAGISTYAGASTHYNNAKKVL